MTRPILARFPSVLVIAAATALPAFAQTTQEHVHEHGSQVMPFDLGKTVHVFRMTETGGTQRVVTRGDSAQPEQVRMIQRHLMMEAGHFQQGDFSDPAHLHGPAMPGLKALEAGASRVRVTYRPLPNGGEIEFRSRDIRLITAIHRWFGAQLSEHGADARAE